MKRTASAAALLLLPALAAADPGVTEVSGRLGTVRLLASGPQRGDKVRIEFAPTEPGAIRTVCMEFDASVCNRYVPFAPSFDLPLPGWDGSYYLSVFLTGGDKQPPEVLHVPVVVDRTAPRLRTPAATRRDDAVHVAWIAEATGRADGTLAVRVHATTDGTEPTCEGTPVWEGTGNEATLTGLPPGEPVRLRICASDAAGNLATSEVLEVAGGAETADGEAAGSDATDAEAASP